MHVFAYFSNLAAMKSQGYQSGGFGDLHETAGKINRYADAAKSYLP